MYRYILDKSEDIKVLEVYRSDPYLLNMDNKGSIFLTLKITNKFDYTFSFDGLSELVNYEVPNNINGEKSDIAYANSIINSDEIIIEQRMEVLKNILNFLKNNDLYRSSKIKSIGFAKIFEDIQKYKTSTI